MTEDRIEQRNELLKAVKEHAYDNYENGWDTLVECYDDDEILAAIGDCKTVEEAIATVDDHFGIMVHHEHSKEIESLAF